MKLKSGKTLLSILAALLLAACATISPFNEYAYQQTTSLKVDSLALIGEATEPYSSHVTEVKNLETKIEKQYEYAKGLPKNQITVDQWSIIVDPNRHSLFGYLKYWKSKGTLSPVFVKDAKGEISDEFDQIIGLESGKRKK